MLGTMFGPYRIEELLGRGGMGEVYRAHDTQTDRTVALKVLPVHLAQDDEYQIRFRRECAAAASLNEPHVVPIHHFGDVDGRLFLDMRLVKGVDLGAWLAAHGPMPADVAVAVVTQVAQALDAAHSEGLVHRDVKPSNVLLAGVSGPEVEVAQVFAYLLDFGIARSRDDAPLTAVGQIVGTHRYMAPERFEGSEGDPRADVYALACVLHQALTGAPPFEGRLPELMAAHLRQAPPKPSALRAGLPPALDDVVATGMAKDPRERYPSAGELARAARAAIGASSAYFTVPGATEQVAADRIAPVRSPPPRPRAYEPLSSPRALATPPPGYDAPSVPRVPAASSPRLEPLVYEEVSFPPPVPPPPAAAKREASAARLLLLALGVFAVVAAATGLVLYLVGAFTPASQMPGEDAQLVAALPTGFGASNCGLATVERDTSGALSYLACGPGPANGPTTSRFARFGTQEKLDQEFERLAGDRLTTEQGTASACRAGDTVRTTWSRGTNEVGSLVCYVGPDGKAYVLWTDTEALALGYVRRDDGDAAVLYDWWTSNRIKPRG